MVVREISGFGDLVRSHRRRLGLTQEDLAERAGLSERAIGEMERGSKHVPRKETVQLLAEALELGDAEREAFQLAAHRTRVLGHLDLPQSLDQNLVTSPTNLPADSTPFIGREEEVAQLLALLHRPAVRLVTLTGPGGIGKTRLALQAAALLRDAFVDGIRTVSLASLHDPDLVPAAIALTLGIEERAGQPLLETVTRFLRTKRLLLLLDNYEHLLPAAEVVSQLLATCPQLQILVTSRAVLHLAAEHEYPVPPLTLPDPAHLPDLEVLAQCDAIALFLERAQAVQPKFALTRQNARVVAEICSQLDGLPLAIELAAPWLRLFPPQGLRERLAQRLNLLTGGARDHPARHQTLRAAIDWSYSLLSEGERKLFARLSVFAGGCTLEAAEMVCNTDGSLGINTLEGVASLVEQSLARQQGDGKPRFGLLSTIQEYAHERLVEDGEAELLRERHARYYLALAEQAAAQPDGPAQVAQLNRPEAERDNLRAALRWAHESGASELGVRLALALSRFWAVRGPLGEGRRWLESMAAACDASPLKARALGAAARLALSRDGPRALDLAEQSLALFRELGDQAGTAEALNLLVLPVLDQGDMDRAAAIGEEGVALSETLGEKGTTASALEKLGRVAWQRGENSRANDLAERSFELYRELGDARGMGETLNVLICVAESKGDSRRVRDLLAQGAALLRPESIADQLGHDWLWDLLHTARVHGSYDQARTLAERGMAVCLQVEDRRNAAYMRNMLSLIEREQGHYERAIALAEESLTCFEEAGDEQGIAETRLKLADVARDQGDAERVIDLCEEARGHFESSGDGIGWAFCLNNLALAVRHLGDHARAAMLLEQVLASSLPALATTELLISRGLVALDTGDYRRARDAFVASITTGWRLLPAPLATILEGLAGVAVGNEEGEREGTQLVAASRLFGAAAAIRAAVNVPMPPIDRFLYDRRVAAARAGLGNERFEQYWCEGQTMTADQAISYAVRNSTDPLGTQDVFDPAWDSREASSGGQPATPALDLRW